MKFLQRKKGSEIHISKNSCTCTHEKLKKKNLNYCWLIHKFQKKINGVNHGEVICIIPPGHYEGSCKIFAQKVPEIYITKNSWINT